MTSTSDQYTKDEKFTEITLVKLAMDIISSSTQNCVRFVERSNETDYIYITRGRVCNSDVGRYGGRQIVSLTRGCLEEIGAIQHELLHALGFYHEHSRADRDNYIWIKWDNIRSSAMGDFNISTDADSLELPYDYYSVLHYPWNAFAANNKEPTIIGKKMPEGKQIGQRSNLSQLDSLKIKYAYGCKLTEIDCLVPTSSSVPLPNRHKTKTTTTSSTTESDYDYEETEISNILCLVSA